MVKRMLDFFIFEDFLCGAQQYLVAKTGKKWNEEWLPVWAHLLDTAGIMEYLLSRWVPDAIESRQNLSEDEWKKVCIFLALVHDIGKCTPIFQSRITAQIPELHDMICNHGLEIPHLSAFGDPGKTPHGLSGESILYNLGCPAGVAAVVGAHHGCPQEADADVEQVLMIYEENLYGQEGRQSQEGEKWETLRSEWLKLALRGCGYAGIEDVPQLDVPTQMLAAGLVIMADWIASNTSYFPLFDLEDKGEIRLYPARVQEAWERLSLPQQWYPHAYYMGELEFLERFGFTWNTVQQYMVQAVEESGQPGIFILEAQMGVGKTEAALAGAELLASKYEESGIFFGLPTQATANGIFPRLKQWAQQQSEWAQHGIRLAHGMADLNEDYRSIFHGRAVQNEDEDPAGLVVHPWFEGRKQAMLSQFVIGTVDQLLMLALKQKHVMLRHLGLAGKVIIIDECHAYDAYMNRYLDRALNWLGRYGVPVILLSATLPARRRRELVLAYQNIEKKGGQILSWQDNRSYPLLTWTDGEQVCQRAIPVNQSHKSIHILKAEREKLTELVKQTVLEGGCAGIVMNTVDQAQKCAQELKDFIPGCRVILIHSRFLMADRTLRERELLHLLGKKSVPEQRKGLIVVGTQILEQSLDIDFDFLITQICPMDLLLQRLGRLHRHDRKRPKRLENAVCAVLDPASPDDGTTAVYGRWLIDRTAELLPEQIDLPDDISDLVQDTYAAGNECLPESDPRLVLWEEYQAEIKMKERKAQNYRILNPDILDETIHGLLDSSQDDSEWIAQASVRDGEPGADVLVMEYRDSGEVAFLPWQQEGVAVPRDHIPSEQECRNILRQRIQLPRALCGRKLDRTIEHLEGIQRSVVPEWQHAPLLQGELFLFLNEQGKAVLSEYELTYTREMGLQLERKEM